MWKKIKENIPLMIVILLALLIFRNLFFNITSLDKMIFLGGSQKETDQSFYSLLFPAGKTTKIDIPTVFPENEGRHDNLQSESWCFIGHLEEKDNSVDKFGLTLCFFKNPAFISINITDGVKKQNFSSVIDFNNYDILANNKLEIRKRDISWVETGNSKYAINFKFKDREFNLNLNSLKKPSVFYNDAEKFYSEQTEIKVEGELRLPASGFHKITGLGWIEHQGFNGNNSWKSWRWYALQLNNDIEMVFRGNITFKSAIGGVERANLYIFGKNGEREIIGKEEYKIKDLEYWLNPETKINYPVKWQISIPGRNIELTAVSLIPDQVMEEAGGFYKGTCLVSGIFEGENVAGRAQLEFMPSS